MPINSLVFWGPIKACCKLNFNFIIKNIDSDQLILRYEEEEFSFNLA